MTSGLLKNFGPQNSFDKFFSPLKEDGDLLPFPGFGFWYREYAELLHNLTYPDPEIVGDPQGLCDFYITYLFNLTSSASIACPPLWDKISCFPGTDAGQLSVIPCPHYIQQTQYDTSGKQCIFLYFVYINKTCVLEMSCIQCCLLEVKYFDRRRVSEI